MRQQTAGIFVIGGEVVAAGTLSMTHSFGKDALSEMHEFVLIAHEWTGKISRELEDAIIAEGKALSAEEIALLEPAWVKDLALPEIKLSRGQLTNPKVGRRPK